MADVAVSPPHVTTSARTFLAGRPVHVRASRRNGCCGGTASVPVAEPGSPEMLDEVERFDVAGTVVYLDRGLPGACGSWTIDVDGFGRWRRLVVVGAELGPG
ncbi:MAG: CC/Se motif family (seleno)protein [Acidimicrobiia bacterium]